MKNGVKNSKRFHPFAVVLTVQVCSSFFEIIF